MSYTFHVLAVPHTISTKEYSACAFTTKTVKLCAMLHDLGHKVIHYGHEESSVKCTEHVTVVKSSELEMSYPGHDWRTLGFPRYSHSDLAYVRFFERTDFELSRRKNKGDFLLCTFGNNHKRIALSHPDIIAVEPGIGYPDGGFAQFRVFESYAIMHCYLGTSSVSEMNNSMWYDVVIPNFFDVDDFKFDEIKDDYFLFLGRVGPGKGVHIALQIVHDINSHLIVAGSGSLTGHEVTTKRPFSEFSTCVGVVGPAERAKLLSKAKAVIAPSMFLEPFCGVQVEAMLSGTPVISTDWGAFAEYNLHGKTGFRCRTYEHFLWAARNIDQISPFACRRWAEENFSMDRVAQMYDEYFFSVKNIFGGDGWYQQNLNRRNLDWLTRGGLEISTEKETLFPNFKDMLI